MPYVTPCLVHCMQCQCIASNSWKLVPTPNATHNSLMPRLSTALPANTSTYQWKQDYIFSFLTSSMIALETGKRYALITKILWFLLVLHTLRGWYKDNLEGTSKVLICKVDTDMLVLAIKAVECLGVTQKCGLYLGLGQISPHCSSWHGQHTGPRVMHGIIYVTWLHWVLHSVKFLEENVEK